MNEYFQKKKMKMKGSNATTTSFSGFVLWHSGNEAFGFTKSEKIIDDEI